MKELYIVQYRIGIMYTESVWTTSHEEAAEAIKAKHNGITFLSVVRAEDAPENEKKAAGLSDAMNGFYRVSIPTKGRDRLEAIADYIDTTLWCTADHLGNTSEAIGEWIKTAYDKYSPDTIETLVEIHFDNVTDIYYVNTADTVRHEKYID